MTDMFREIDRVADFLAKLAYNFDMFLSVLLIVVGRC